jgi:FemAB-related protein (PEP-CTERM system-associated)
VEVMHLSQSVEAEWDDYVRQCGVASPFHLLGWKHVMEQTYGYPSHHLAAKEAGRIEGVLPLFEIRSRLMGNYVTTLPGGLCTDKREAAELLIDRAKEIAVRTHGKHLVLRDSLQGWDSELSSVDGYYTAIRDLSSDVESVWSSLDRDTRRQVRLAKKNDLQASVGGIEYIDDFYAHFSAFARNMGMPVFSKQFLARIARELPELPLIFLVRRKGVTMAAHWAFSFRDTIFGFWGGSSGQHLALGPEYLTYWEHLRYASHRGYSRVDFGRCREGSGHYAFKARWASKFVPLHRQYYLINGNSPPDILTRTRTDPGFQLFVTLWKRLPVRVSRLLGPHVRRHVPFV